MICKRAGYLLLPKRKKLATETGYIQIESGKAHKPACYFIKLFYE